MEPKVMTLCDSCQKLMSESYSVKPYVMGKPTTKLDKKCANCKKPYRASLKLYIVDRKGR